jgi:hypothetical protein
MAPDTQFTDFNATLLTVGLAIALPFDSPFGHSDDAGSESLSAAIKRVDLDDEEDEEDDEDDFDEEGEVDAEEEEDEYEDDDEEDEEYEDDEDEDSDDDEDEDDDIKLI